jgi:hypothetical protein
LRTFVCEVDLWAGGADCLGLHCLGFVGGRPPSYVDGGLLLRLTGVTKK